MEEDSEFSNLSAFSSESDDDVEIFNDIVEIRQNNENYLRMIVPQYSEQVFLEHFRVSRNVIEALTASFQGSEYYKYHSGQNGKISAQDQLLIYLWYIGHQTASFRDVADRFDISKSSLERIIVRITYFLSNKSNSIIKWPNNEEKVDIERHFRRKGFPNVVGVIDGCHIKIDKPSLDPDSYINRQGYYSVQMQAVCDHTMKITDIFVGFPGSVHDSRVFKRSSLSRTMQQKCGDNMYIIGDSGYPLRVHLLTPFQNRGQLTSRQSNYNSVLSRNRYIIEHCFSRLKQKFRQLYHLKLRNIRLITHMIRACCVLHNISLNDEFIMNESDPVQHEIVRNVPEGDDTDSEDEVGDGDAVQIRNNVMNMLR